MKKHTIIIMTLLFGINCCMHEIIVRAEDTNHLLKGGDLEYFSNKEKILQEKLNLGPLPPVNPDSSEELLKYQMNSDDKAEEENIETEFALKNLQIPQKLEVIIDPWELNGKGQVYSETYVICNTGEIPGILTLSNLACTPNEQSGAVVKTEKEGLHNGGDKWIYMEMLLGNGDKIIFSSEKSQYQIKLDPSEKVSVSFAGEVNENAFEEWNDQDVGISVVYSWETVEELSGLNMEVPEDEHTNDTGDGEDKLNEKEEQPQIDISEEEKEENQQYNINIEDMEKQQTSDFETEKQQSILQYENEKELPDISKMNIDEKSKNAEDQSAESRNIELQEVQDVELVVDSWEKNEEGRIVSAQYSLHNAGDTTGTCTLSELICKSQDQNEIIISDKNVVHDSENKLIYMGLVLETGERIDLSHENSEYKIQIKPGEKRTFYFEGEMNENLFESRKAGDIAVMAVCSWDISE